MISDRRVWRGLFRPQWFFLTLALCLSALSLTAQQMPAPGASAADGSVKLKEYEVVSIKENKSSDGNTGWMGTPDGFRTMNMRLKNLIANAYGIRFEDLISGGPDWINSKGFDVQAKVAGPDIEAYKNLNEKDRDAMMKAVLKERFRLQVHIETKEAQVYDLVVAKAGVKMKEAPPDPPQSDTPGDAKPDKKPGPPARQNGSMRMTWGTMSGTGLPMEQIASQLSYMVHHPVNNRTGVDGKYDLELKWNPEEDGPKQDDGSTDRAPSIFTAVQEQLGLKLQSTKGPVETLVIDHVDLPSEN